MTIEPLPNVEVLFASVHEVAMEFLVQHKRVRIRDIQKSHLG
jgi:hypothetical protein